MAVTDRPCTKLSPVFEGHGVFRLSDGFTGNCRYGWALLLWEPYRGPHSSSSSAANPDDTLSSFQYQIYTTFGRQDHRQIGYFRPLLSS